MCAHEELAAFEGTDRQLTVRGNDLYAPRLGKPLCNGDEVGLLASTEVSRYARR